MNKIIVIALVFLSSAAFAGDSGCGLGSLIIQKNSKLLQLFSMTTNGIFLTQPLGITSGTSGCSANGIVSTDKEMEYFVEINNDDLERQMAQGRGEKLQVLAQLSGCHDEVGQKAFYSMTKNSFAEIYPSASVKPQDVVARLKAEMLSDAAVQKSCAPAVL